MDKVLTNRKTFLTALGSLSIASLAFGGKREQGPSARSAAPRAEPLPLKAVKASRSVARGGPEA